MCKVSYLRVVPSSANFFLCEVVSRFSSKELTELLLSNYNVLIKDCGTKKAFDGRQYVRIAIRDHTDNNLLAGILKRL